jgi:hypothetical protein
VVFFGTPVSSTNKTDLDITENNWNIVESGAKHYNPNPSFYDKKKIIIQGPLEKLPK